MDNFVVVHIFVPTNFTNMDIEILSNVQEGEWMMEGLLLLLGINDKGKIDWSRFLKKEHREIYDQLNDKAQVNEFLAMVSEDGFNEMTLGESKLTQFMEDLAVLKEQITNFFFTTTAEKSKDYQLFPDAYVKISKDMVQLMRLRLIIQPDYQFAYSTHSVSGIKYLTVRGFWVDESGKRERKFVKSLGRFDDYKDGKKDPEAHNAAKIKLREVMLEEYKEKYP